MRKNLLLLLLVCNQSVLYAQDFEVLDISQRNGTVYVNFKINANLEYERYKVQLFGSHDNYAKPLTRIEGPTEGEMGTSDETYTLEWKAQLELQNYIGNIQLELRGEVSYLPVHTEVEKIVAKQEKTASLAWKGGNDRDRIRIELLKDGQQVETLAETDNTRDFLWAIPESLPKGNDYQIRWVNLTNEGETFTGPAFKVIGKNAWMIKAGLIAGAVVIGGTVVVLSGGDGGSPTGDEDLIGPPLPGSN